jgi:hypothetical protein
MSGDAHGISAQKFDAIQVAAGLDRDCGTRFQMPQINAQSLTGRFIGSADLQIFLVIYFPSVHLAPSFVIWANIWVI